MEVAVSDAAAEVSASVEAAAVVSAAEAASVSLLADPEQPARENVMHAASPNAISFFILCCPPHISKN